MRAPLESPVVLRPVRMTGQITAEGRLADLGPGAGAAPSGAAWTGVPIAARLLICAALKQPMARSGSTSCCLSWDRSLVACGRAQQLRDSSQTLAAVAVEHARRS